MTFLDRLLDLSLTHGPFARRGSVLAVIVALVVLAAGVWHPTSLVEAAQRAAQPIIDSVVESMPHVP